MEVTQDGENNVTESLHVFLVVSKSLNNFLNIIINLSILWYPVPPISLPPSQALKTYHSTLLVYLNVYPSFNHKEVTHNIWRLYNPKNAFLDMCLRQLCWRNLLGIRQKDQIIRFMDFASLLNVLFTWRQFVKLAYKAQGPICMLGVGSVSERWFWSESVPAVWEHLCNGIWASLICTAELWPCMSGVGIVRFL